MNEDPVQSLARSIVEEAMGVISGDRKKDYGDAVESFNRIANLWKDYTGINMTPKDVAVINILEKCSRLKHSGKRDNWIDIIGYAALGYAVTAYEGETPVNKESKVFNLSRDDWQQTRDNCS